MDSNEKNITFIFKWELRDIERFFKFENHIEVKKMWVTYCGLISVDSVEINCVWF